MGLEQTPVSHTVPIHHTTQQRVVVFAIYCKKVPEVHQLYIMILMYMDLCI